MGSTDICCKMCIRDRYYDISYADRSENNKLDLYLPAEKKEKYPLAVFVHGGAFVKSSRSRHLSNILNCLLYGYAVASIDYRFNNEVTYPEIRRDCIDAFNYLANRPEIDSEKIVLDVYKRQDECTAVQLRRVYHCRHNRLSLIHI